MIHCNQCGAKFLTRRAALDPTFHQCARDFADVGSGVPPLVGSEGVDPVDPMGILTQQIATSSVGAGRTSHEHRDEESALQLLPAAREIRDFVEARIPPGTGWGVFLLPGEDDKDGLRRVLALTSNRDVMARAVGTWLMDVLGPGTYRKEIVVEPDGRRGSMRVPIAETKPGA